MKVIKTKKFAQIARPENVPFTLPTTIPTDPEKLKELEQHVHGKLNFLAGGKPSAMYYDYVPKELRELDSPKMKRMRYVARKFWNEYLKNMPFHYKYVKQPTKDLLTPQTLFIITNYFIKEIIKEINNNNINEANFMLETAPEDIRTKIQDRVAKLLAQQDLSKKSIPNIIRKRTKQLQQRLN